MHSIPPPSRFLVLSAANSAPYNPANKFLVLSPIESGPDEQAVADTISSEASTPAPKSHRSDSSSSVSSNEDQLNDGVVPSGFLYLGATSRRYSR